MLNTEEIRQLITTAALGDVSVRFKAKRELIRALRAIGFKSGIARTYAIAWISEQRREHKNRIAPNPALNLPEPEKRPHVTVEWK